MKSIQARICVRPTQVSPMILPAMNWFGETEVMITSMVRFSFSSTTACIRYPPGSEHGDDESDPGDHRDQEAEPVVARQAAAAIRGLDGHIRALDQPCRDGRIGVLQQVGAQEVVELPAGGSLDLTDVHNAQRRRW